MVFKKEYLKDNLRAEVFQTMLAALDHLFRIYASHNPQDLIETLGTAENQKAPKSPSNQHSL